MINPASVPALKALVEQLYQQIRTDDTQPSVSFLYSLVSLLNVSDKDRERYVSMLILFLNDIPETQSTSFLDKYALPGDLYKRLDEDHDWPDFVLDTLEPLPNKTESQLVVEKKALLTSTINKIRDQKIDGGFTWNGHVYQSRQSDRENIIGSAVAAQLALAQGVQPGNYRWANPNTDFAWITATNDLVKLDAYDVLALYSTGITFKTTLTFYARALKDAMLQLTTLSQLNSFNPTQGWPY